MDEPIWARGLSVRLELQGVSRSVGGEDYLYPLDLTLESGLNVLLGPTLAGKTSLMRLLAGLDKPTAGQVVACRADIDAHLEDCGVDPAAAATVVGVAGTVTQLAAVALDLPAYDREAVDQVVLPTELVLATVDLLLAMTHDERRAIPSMHPGRADVIAAGGLILASVLRRAGASELVVSESDRRAPLELTLPITDERRYGDTLIRIHGT